MSGLARTRLQRAPLLLLALSVLLLPLFQPLASAEADRSGEAPSKPCATVDGQDFDPPEGGGGNDPTGEGDPDDFDLVYEVIASLLFMKYFLIAK